MQVQAIRETVRISTATSYRVNSEWYIIPRLGMIPLQRLTPAQLNAFYADLLTDGRRLREGGLALYDLTSSYFEGSTCPLAARGYSRDSKKGTLQVNYGLLTDDRGCPVSVSVFKGNVGDPKTLMSQVTKCRDRFGIKRFVLVGDRGMITQKQVDELGEKNVDWITALRPDAIRKLVGDGSIQMGLFDERNIAEMQHDDFPGERLVVCAQRAVAHECQRQIRFFLDHASERAQQHVDALLFIVSRDAQDRPPRVDSGCVVRRCSKLGGV